MYQEYYQLKEAPFNVTADSSFFFSSPRHTEAYTILTYGISQRKGILLLTGGIGAGKTTLCRTLLKHLDHKTKTAFILNPRFSELQLLQLIVRDLGIAGNYRNKFTLINALNDFLLEESAKGHNVVIILDEVQNLTVKQLEQIRLLSNLETEKEKLLQMILVGQPELVDKLKLPALRQLNQRISVRYHLSSLLRSDISDYIQHRLSTASIANDKTPAVQFTEAALDTIYQYTQGTPRMINILCDRALLAGYVAEKNMIDEKIISQCAEEVYIT